MSSVDYFNFIMQKQKNENRYNDVSFIQNSPTVVTKKRNETKWIFNLFEKESDQIAKTHNWISNCALYQCERPNNTDVIMFYFRLKDTTFVFQFFTSQLESRSIISVSYASVEGFKLESEKWTVQDREKIKEMLGTVEQIIQELRPYRLLCVTREITFQDKELREAIQNQDNDNSNL